MKALRGYLVAAVLGAVGLGAGLAAAAPVGRPLEPTDVQTHGSWTVRCFPIHSQSPCDMFELLANKTSGKRVMSISIAYVPASDRHVIQIAVPLGIAIPSGLTLEAGQYTSPVLPYRRCDREGCYIEAVMDGRIVAALASTDGAAKARIASDDGRKIAISFSLNGFADAHGAMADLARKKTSAAPDGAPAPQHN